MYAALLRGEGARRPRVEIEQVQLILFVAAIVGDVEQLVVRRASGELVNHAAAVGDLARLAAIQGRDEELW